MGLSKRLSSYNDCREIWDTIVLNSGGTLELKSKGRATYIRQRLHQYRNLFSEQISPETPFDEFTIIKNGKMLTFNKRQVQGTIRKPDGKVAEFTVSASSEDMLADATKLLDELEVKDD